MTNNQRPKVSKTMKSVPNPSDLLNPVSFPQFGQWIIVMAAPPTREGTLRSDYFPRGAGLQAENAHETARADF
jgi:hypothetical protein